MITRERIQQLCEQAATIASGVENDGDQFKSYGLEPDDAANLIALAKSIGDTLEMPIEAQLSFCLLIGILIGRDQ